MQSDMWLRSNRYSFKEPIVSARLSLTCDAVLALFSLSMLLAAGCSNPDRASLAQLFQQLEVEVTGKLRPEITSAPQGQRSITLFRDSSHDTFEVVDRFLKSEPSLTDAARETVVRYRDASKRAYEYYDEFIQRQDFELSEAERRRGRELLDAELHEMRLLADILDGKTFY
jgi:hypothetical protein